MRLAVLMAVIVAFATVAAGPPPPEPEGFVGHLDEKTLILILWYRYVSEDGGLTWQYLLESDVYEHHVRRDDRKIKLGSDEIHTPTGTYTIEGENIIRTFEGRREVAYSPPHLQNRANERFQAAIDSPHIFACCKSSEPRNLVYDTHTGNIVVAMRRQGVLVGDSNGNWKRVAVDDRKMPYAYSGYGPTDFSLTNKFRVILRSEYFWWAAIAISISATATALALAHFSRATNGVELIRKHIRDTDFRKQRRIANKRNLIIAITVGVVIVFLCSIAYIVTYQEEEEGLILISIFAVLIILGLCAPKAAPPTEMSVGTLVGVLSLSCSVITSIVGLIKIFATSDSSQTALAISLGLGMLFGVAASKAFRPSYSQIPVVLLTLLGMIALFMSAFAIGIIQDFNLIAAKFYAVALILIASFTLWFYLRRSQPSSQSKED